jgi:hypothetical protein
MERYYQCLQQFIRRFGANVANDIQRYTTQMNLSPSPLPQPQRITYRSIQNSEHATTRTKAPTT